MTKLKLIIGQWLANVTRKLRNNFYLYLAVLLTTLILLDASVFHIGENMRDKAFDLMVKNRIIKPQADPDIVIVDVNEASLAAMAGDYGRWPWPRQVFGEFVENIEAQKPKAIVFDILFSDADVYNPDSDAYFNEVIKNTSNTYFPFLRLPEEQDKLSKVKASMIPGLKTDPASEVNPDTTIAVVLPHFDAILNSKRLGTHNIDPDKDGITREYKLWRTTSGWQIPALPLVVGQSLQIDNINLPQDMLINWRGAPFTYHFVSFSDVMTDMSNKVKKRPQDEFKDKIVIIGSTAPSLFDLKATPMAKIHPGVEILATAIDNVKHGDFLYVLRGVSSYILMSLIFIWLTTAAFYFNMDRDRFTKLFSTSQIGLLVLSYIGINLTHTYLDFTGPITWAVGYFSVAKIYAMATDLALQRYLAFGVKSGEKSSRALIMPVLIESDEPLNDATLKKIKRNIELLSKTPNNIEFIRGTQSGIWGLFGDMLVVTWTYSDAKTDYSKAANEDAMQLSTQLTKVVTNSGLPINTQIRYTQHEGLLNTEHSLARQWRTLFAQAVIKLEIDIKPSL